MTDNIIEGDACTSRISSLSPLICSFIVDTRRSSAIGENKGIHDVIELKSGDPGIHVLTNHIERHSCELSGLTDSLYLFGGFDKDFRHKILVLSVQE